MTQPTLYTERLQLVPLTDAHLELEIALDSDPEVMRYLTGRALSRAEVERAHLRRVAAAREVPGLGLLGRLRRWRLRRLVAPATAARAGSAESRR